MIEIEKITDVLHYVDGLKAVIFDLDDTLYGEKEYIRSGYRKITEFLPQVPCMEEKLWKAFESGRPAVDEVLFQEGIYTDQLKAECLTIYRSQKPEIHLYPGVEEMLEALLESGYQLGLITDGRPEGQRAKIEALGLRKYIRNIIITDELGGSAFRKLNPAAFRLMRKQWGVEYGEMCYVGDNVEKDFTAPGELGMRCVWFRNGVYRN